MTESSQPSDGTDEVDGVDEVDVLMRRVFAMPGLGGRTAEMKVCSRCGLRLNSRRSRCPMDGQPLYALVPEVGMPAADAGLAGLGSGAGGPVPGVATVQGAHLAERASVEAALKCLTADHGALECEIGALQTSMRDAELATIAACRTASQRGPECAGHAGRADSQADWQAQRRALWVCVAQLDAIEEQLAATLIRRKDFEFQIEQLRGRLASLPARPAGA